MAIVDLTCYPCWLIMTKLYIVLVYKVKFYELKIELYDRARGCLIVLHVDYVFIFFILDWLMILLANHYFVCDDTTRDFFFIECKAYPSDCSKTSTMTWTIFKLKDELYLLWYHGFFYYLWSICFRLGYYFSFWGCIPSFEIY